ncbi:MAG TPA: hypothetical protein P5119_04230 [Candidatus Aminicenantes bacterium]|nr:hypothetical protein [Candidatus Aminicenantes bacterium]HRY64532.1 hypothetical protein [Candidatus Aminicenantes bacterium]HRZ71445.1 hypothetical protein [Candidatus Aminicenantes bacterium]
MRQRSPGLRRLARLVLPAALVALAASLFLGRRLPGRDLILEPLGRSPVQTEEGVPEPFEVARRGFTYTVTPLYSYELWGLVVSYHHSSSFLDISHKKWNDYLNTKDICVIWGRNVETGVYRRMTFRNRDFTCYYRYPDRETGQLFTENALSNNHLLPADELVAEAVRRARTGDQVHFKGWLVSYGLKGAPYSRGSSTVRTDRGNGACEVVYVTEFEILRPANTAWRAARKISLVLAGLALGVLIFV